MAAAEDKRRYEIFDFERLILDLEVGNTIGVLDFSPTFIIKPYHQKGGTEVPPYDIDKLLFVGLSTNNFTKTMKR